MTTLTNEELVTLEAMEAQAKMDAIGYWQIYEWLADLLESKGVPVSDSTVLWLRGATEANAGRGAFSELIRAYTSNQAELRYGSTVSATQMQEASNAVAQNLIDDLLGRNQEPNGTGWPRGQVPDITRIAEADATQVGLVLFNIAGDTIAPPVNAAWSGSLLFTLLGSNQNDRLMSTGDSVDQIDTVNDWRDVLFAYDSYLAGLKAAFVAFSSESQGDLEQYNRDVGIMGETIQSYLSVPGQTFDNLWDALPFASLNNPVTTTPALRDAFRLIDTYGEERILDWLHASITGDPVVPTTNVTFAANAKAFADAIGTDGKTWDVQFITDSNQLMAMAKGEGAEGLAARNALHMLSPMVVSGLDLSQRNLDLYDPTTDEGDLSEAWIADRSTMLSWVLRKTETEGGALRIDGPYTYDFKSLKFNPDGSDLTLQVTSKTNPTSPQHIQIVFGSEEGDTINGMDVAIGDHLYGADGSDTIKGNGGDDYIEGNAGVDKLFGGTGRDELLGGEGNDVLDGGSGTDVLKGGKGNDTYVFRDGDGIDTIVDTDGQDKIMWGADANGEGGEQLTGGKEAQAGSGVWESEDGKYQYRLITEDDASETLVISNGVDFILVKEFVNGMFEIQLEDGEDSTPPLTVIAGTEDQDYLYPPLEAEDTVLWGGEEIDIVTGRSGDDEVYGDVPIALGSAIEIGAMQEATGALGDWLNGRDGNDTVIGDAGNDMLFGGDGDDILVGGGGDDYLSGDDDYTGAHNSWAVIFDGPRDFDPSLDANFIVGFDNQNNFGNDVIYGGAGNDVVTGLAGKDILYGESGNDNISGDDDDDFLSGGDGDDEMTGDYGQPAYASGAGIVIQGNDYLDGGNGNDWMQGEGGDDQLFGGAGDDQIWGDAQTYTADDLNGEDYIDGGNGNDLLVGQGGADEIYGGNGDDQLFGDSDQILLVNQGADYLDGQDGNDYLRGYAGNDQLFGGKGEDQILGNEGDDFIDGEDDNDLISAGEGNDFVFGGNGDDVIYGDEGNDYVNGGDGSNTLDGGEGDDTLVGGQGNDYIFGGVGSDLIYGNAGDDNITGEDGDDLIEGGDGDDLLLGEGGDDVLNGGRGVDILAGGQGNDTYIIDGKDTIIDNEGENTLDFGSADFSNFHLEQETSDEGENYFVIKDIASGNVVKLLDGQLGWKGSYKIGDVQMDHAMLMNSIATGNLELKGSVENDELIGGSQDDVIDGGKGGDTLNGGKGDDTYIFHMGDGVDLINDGEGINRIKFGSGVALNDISLNLIAGDDGDALSIEYGDQQDAIHLKNGMFRANDLLEFNDGTSFSIAELLRNGPALTAYGPSTGGVASGSDLNDFFYGGEANDVLRGQGGDDSLDGGGGDDQISGGSGNDLLVGGDGNDTYLFNLGDGLDIVTEESWKDSGNDQIIFGAGLDLNSAQISQSYGENGKLYLDFNFGNGDRLSIENGVVNNVVESFVFSDGTVLSLDEMKQRLPGLYFEDFDYQDDEFSGSNGNDLILGRDGDDVLSGLDGDDILEGGVGQDTLVGGDGNDELIGGADDDTLIGGEGGDVYHFSIGMGRDLIIDQNDSSNEIHIDANVNLANLISEQVGNDLVIRLRDKSTSITLKDYYAISDPQWQVKYANNVSVPIEDFLEDLNIPSSNIEEIISLFKDRTLSNAKSDLYADNWRLEEDGKYHKRSDWITGSSSNLTRTIEDSYTTINFVSQSSNDESIYLNGSSNENTTIVSQTTEVVTRNLNDEYRVVWGNDSTFSSPKFIPIWQMESGGMKIPSDLIVRYVTNDFGEVTGAWFYPPEFFVSDDNDVTTSTTVKKVETEYAYELVDFHGGDADNFIETTGMSVVDGGDGNDVIQVVDSGVLWHWDALLYGNAGNDVLIGGEGDDVLIGGTGDDDLDGGYGADTYYLSGQGGVDHIIDSGEDDYAYQDWFYKYRYISDPAEELNHPGVWQLSVANDFKALCFESYESAYQYASTVLTVTYGYEIEEISEDLAFLWSGDPEKISGNDYSKLENLYEKSIISLDRLVLAEGTNPGNVGFSIGKNYDELILAMPDETQVFIQLAKESDAIGTGIEIIQFADGSSMTIGEALSIVDGQTSKNGTQNIDLIYSGNGNDVIFAFGGDDEIETNGGNDVIDGGAGNDLLNGGLGDDVYIFGHGDGIDEIDQNSAAAMDVDIIRLKENVLSSDVLLTREGDTLVLEILSTGDRISQEDWFVGGINRVSRVEFSDGTSWDLRSMFKEILNGSEDEDLLEGNEQDSYQFGMGGDDDLYGNAGNDVLNGGAGNDYLVGGLGDDVYVFERGDGVDVVDQIDAGVSDVDVIRFGEGISVSDVLVIRNESTLIFSIRDSNDSVTLQNFLDSDLYKKTKIEFFDGTVWDSNTVIENSRSIISGTEFDDEFYGDDGADTLFGQAGNDYLDGYDGKNYVSGGDGNDTLYAGYDDDVLSGDDGDDMLYGWAGNDYLEGGEGSDYLESANDGQGVSILFAGKGDDGLFDTSGNSLLFGGEGDDYFYQNGVLPSILVGGKGNDWFDMSAWLTPGFFAFNIGDGQDIFGEVEELSVMTLSLGGGASVSDLSFRKDGDAIFLKIGSNDSIEISRIFRQEWERPSVTLQIIGEDIRTYDLTAAFSAYEAAISHGVSPNGWSLAGYLGSHVKTVSQDQVIGGILAYRYAKDGNFDALSNSAVFEALRDSISFVAAQEIVVDEITAEILQGGFASDTLGNVGGNGLFNSLVGDDVMTGGAGNDLFVGGKGNDTITTGAGADIIAFNLGDGQDIVTSSNGGDDTLSLGNGIDYASLKFKKTDDDLILITGSNEQITLQDWYADEGHHSIGNLQVVIEGMSGYDVASSDVLYNKKVVKFDFEGLVAEFDQARTVTPALTDWALSSSLMDFYLQGSDTEAMGGDLTYQYGKTGSLSGISMLPAQAIMGSSQFGINPQALQTASALADSSPRLG
ncbi:calcium-binding protein [Oxalicibacterium solurbis]|uniref:Hemolysin-type calcium-binding protein n=1 Tax=Oxalicibacterium solurbis TaxID=69280 RepID=A0A8J3B035_9BURK|nr:calcium-binding protein [Oxalicibacterium solurbis]GGI54681.1 hemolysin-type calcium-binding protein [Oxalicibacterium solurbis]